MDDMSGVADQRDALGDERTRHVESKRVNAPCANRCNVAEVQLETLLEFGMEFVGRQSDDAFGFAAGLGPDDRRAPALERQDGERSGWQKVLLRPAFVIALVTDINDNRRLAIGPAV